MRVLVTGHRGYIGSVMVSVLKHARFDVVGLDCDLFAGCDFGRTQDSTPSFDIDLRVIEFTDLLSFDAVVHLAALPEDTQNQFAPRLIDEVNRQATVRLAECCKRASVSRFLLASTCAVYGRHGGELQDETSLTFPLTSYAKSKLDCERDLARMADRNFAPVFLRNGTVYGVSPRLRLDTAVNEFVGSAVANGRIEMKTEGRAWRPFIHVEDVSRVFAAVLAAPDGDVASQIFNVVLTEENYRVIEAADEAAEAMPLCSRSAPAGVFDQRSYRVAGNKLARVFPDLPLRWTLRRGVRQLRDAMTASGLTPGDWRSDRYRRILHLQSRMERGELDSSLYAREPVAAM